MSLLGSYSLTSIPSSPISLRPHSSVAHGRMVQCSRRCELFDLHQELIPYDVAWSWQKDIVREKKSQIENEGDCSDTLIILQHPSVYTLGTASTHHNLNFDIENPPFPIYRTERGGEVTFHGPGQVLLPLVIFSSFYRMILLSFLFFTLEFGLMYFDFALQLIMYPIINLRRHKMDLHWYLRTLEEVVIRALSSTFSIQASRVEGLTGVWVGKSQLSYLCCHLHQQFVNLVSDI